MRIVFLTQRLPYAPNRGDRVRAWHELRVLGAKHEVHLAALVHNQEEASHAADLAGLVASVSVIRVTRVRNLLLGAASLASTRPLTHVLLDSPDATPALASIVAKHDPQLVIAFCSSMARFAMQPPLAQRPFLLDMVDVDSAKWAALAPAASTPRRWVYRRESRLLGRFEGLAARSARRVFVVNAREADNLRELAGDDVRIEVLENGVDASSLRAPGPPIDASDVVFCGVMDYAPNEQAALWMVSAVWPSVATHCPAARLWLVGSNPTRRLLNACAGVASVTVTGMVPDVRPYLWKSAVSVAPLLVARGIQNKVLEAVAAGLPTVVTPAVAAGLPAEVLPACSVEESPDRIAAAIVALLRRSPQERRAQAETARLDELTWDAKLQPLLAAV
jgi:polysaccharide biosynthesis protein PslH